MRGLILAAGMGERLRPLTLKRAKPAIEFLNIPMLTFPYYWLDRLGLSDLVLNTHYLPESVRAAAIHSVTPETQLHFTHEDAILGSGGGIWNARFHLQWDTDFAVANGDGVILFEEPDALEQMLRFHRAKKALATLLVCPLEGVGTRLPGVWQDKYGEVVHFGKVPRRDYLECLHYASVMFLAQRLWQQMPEGPSNILYDVLDQAISQGEKVYGYRVDNMRWFETGSPADYLAATRTCLELLREGSPMGQALLQMLKRFAPAHEGRSDFARLRLVDDTSVVENDVKLEGFLVIGAGAHVEAGVTLENCVVLPRAHVRTGEAHKDAVLG